MSIKNTIHDTSLVIGYHGWNTSIKQASCVIVSVQISLTIKLSGEKKIKWMKRTWLYSGELDIYGKACGIGQLATTVKPYYVYDGTFYNDRPHGFCK